MGSWEKFIWCVYIRMRRKEVHWHLLHLHLQVLIRCLSLNKRQDICIIFRRSGQGVVPSTINPSLLWLLVSPVRKFDKLSHLCENPSLANTRDPAFSFSEQESSGEILISWGVLFQLSNNWREWQECLQNVLIPARMVSGAPVKGCSVSM